MHSASAASCRSRLSLSTFTLLALGALLLLVTFSTVHSPLAARPEATTNRRVIPPAPSRSALPYYASEDQLRVPRSHETALFEHRASNLSSSGLAPTNAGSTGAVLFGTDLPPGGEMSSSVPYAVLGVATSPKNGGHRAWIRGSWCHYHFVTFLTSHMCFPSFHPAFHVANISCKESCYLSHHEFS